MRLIHKFLKAAYNSTYTKGRVSCSKDSFDGYFPSQASDIISDKLGAVIVLSNYYKLLIKFGITDQNFFNCD